MFCICAKYTLCRRFNFYTLLNSSFFSKSNSLTLIFQAFIILVSLSLVFIFKLVFTKIPIQPLREPREHHLDDVRRGMLKPKFNINLMSLFTNQNHRFFNCSRRICQ